MRFIIIGLGSMGKRRIKLLKDNFDDINLYGIDLNESRRSEVESLYKIKCFSNINSINEKIDAAFICSPPLSHKNIILECMEKKLNIFSELNLVSDGYDEIIQEIKSNNIVFFLSSTLLYRKEIEYIYNKIINEKNICNYRYHVGQYLPDWHPWEDYKNYFVSDQRTNACREILAIELPWIIKTFGKIRNFLVTRKKITNLDIDYPDCYNIIFEHESGHNGVLTVDIVSRKAIRNLEIYSENIHIFWNGHPSGLEEFNIESKSCKSIDTYENINQNNKYANNIVENAYLDEIKTFIKNLNGENIEKYTIKDDFYTLDIIDSIEGIH